MTGKHTSRRAGRVFLILLSTHILALSCSPRIVEKVRVEYRTQTEVQVDTFWRDRFRIIREKGDTVHVIDSILIRELHWRDRHDTLLVRDTIPVPVDRPVEVQVEKPLNAWQKFRIGAFLWLLGLAAVGWRKQLLWLIKKVAALFG